MRAVSKSRPATWRRSPIRRWSTRSSNSSFVRWIPRAPQRRQSCSSAASWHGLARAAAFGLLGCRDLGAAAVRFARRRTALFRDSARCRISAGRERLARSAAGNAARRQVRGDIRRSARDRAVCHARAAAARVYAAAVPATQRRADDRARRRDHGGTGGESGTATMRTLTSGSYASLAAGELHFAHTKNGAIVQIFGMGPFEIGG